MAKYYLAYGSNLNKTEMKERCPFSRPIGTTFLEGYRLVFKGQPEASFLTIEQCEGSSIPVGVFKITSIDEANLDYYEGFPTLYSKETVEVSIKGKKISALIYVMNPFYSYNLPSPTYLTRCAKGYEDFNIDIKYLHQARKTTEENIDKTLTK